MMTTAKIALVVLTLLPAAALAQPTVIELQAVDARQPLQMAQVEATHLGCARGVGCGEHAHKLALEAAMEDDPAYVAARARKIAGIVLLSAGGGGAALMGLIALFAEWGEDYPEVYEEEDNTARNFGIAALCSLGVALAVGLPVLISGVLEGRAIRRRAQRRLAVSASWELASGPGQVGMGLRYNF